jgi:hypothetical protein
MDAGDDGTSPFGSNVPGGRCADPGCPCNRPLEPRRFGFFSLYSTVRRPRG